MQSEGTESMKLLWQISKIVYSKIHFDEIRGTEEHETVMVKKQNGSKIYFDEIRGTEKHETVMVKKRKDGNHQKIKQIAKD